MQGYFFWRLVLNYIIFDLEWNNAYNYATKSGMNEIIEIGAVKLNERLEIVDTFKQLIKPQVSKKLSGRFKNLTKITNEEINEFGIPFKAAIDDFKRWSRGKDNVFMSWSNSDLYVLTNNFLNFLGGSSVDFMGYYCDAQKYCMHFVPNELNENNNQIGLSRCAEIFNLDVDTENLHRALSDCYLTAECLKYVFDKDVLQNYICKCDVAFFERLLFKPYMITAPVNDRFNINEIEMLCPKCKGDLLFASKIEVRNKAFCFATKCSECGKKFWGYVRAKQTYDDVVVMQRYVEMNKKRAKKLDK